MERIPISGPSITQKEIDYVTDAVTTAWYGNANKYHEKFEQAFAEYLNMKFAVALPSCTSAIHLSLLALGIGPGDEVIVPDITWIASAAPIHYVGASTVFADINENSWCLSAEAFEECITPRTKAIIPVDLYGNMPDWDALREVAQRHDVAIIEDAAEAIGSQYKNKFAGSFGETGVFSFHGSKTLTTGEGGMLVTNDEDIYKKVLFLRDHGRPPGDTMFCNTEIAYKYKMSSMQAALGLAQIERIEELVAMKRHIFAEYQSQLSNVDGIILNSEAPEVRNTFWMVTVVLDEKFGVDKSFVMERMRTHGVDCRPFFHPLSTLPAYKNSLEAQLARKRNEVSYRISPRGINLPSGLNMTPGKVALVCDALKNTLGI